MIVSFSDIIYSNVRVFVPHHTSVTSIKWGLLWPSWVRHDPVNGKTPWRVPDCGVTVVTPFIHLYFTPHYIWHSMITLWCSHPWKVTSVMKIKGACLSSLNMSNKHYKHYILAHWTFMFLEFNPNLQCHIDKFLGRSWWTGRTMVLTNSYMWGLAAIQGVCGGTAAQIDADSLIGGSESIFRLPKCLAAWEEKREVKDGRRVGWVIKLNLCWRGHRYPPFHPRDNDNKTLTHSWVHQWKQSCSPKRVIHHLK